MNNYQQIKAIFAGLILSSSVVPMVMADDTEIYTSTSVRTDTGNPNIMFVIDTSFSMETGKSKVKPSYVASDTYSGDCVTTAIYFVEDGLIPDCSTSLTNYFNASALECDHAEVGYEYTGYDESGDWQIGDKITPGQVGSLLKIGTYSDQFAQWDTDASPDRWRELSTTSTSDRDFKVECYSDNGNSRANGINNEYIIDSGSGYTGTEPADIENPHPIWAGGAGNLQLFSGNYVNYVNWVPTTGELELKSYLEQVKAAVDTMVRGNTRVDIGLMQFDGTWDGNGGAVQYPILDVGADRNNFFTLLKNLKAAGYTPLSEVYYEALLYFGGKTADFSKLSNPGNQEVSRTMMPGGVDFRSPITGTCDKNYIVMLSDGAPRKDDITLDQQRALPDFPVGTCSTHITSDDKDDNRDAFSSSSSDVDNCFDELAKWAANEDVLESADVNPLGSPTAGDGMQNITTHTIGFFLDDLDAVQLMTEAAENGGGAFYQASSEAELIEIFNKIIAGALDVNTTFASPAVSVNAFNRSTHLDDLYFTLFRPEFTKHWPGNLKKYKLKFDDDGKGFIADKEENDAVDAVSGFFKSTAQSYWSVDADGERVLEGGAANVLDTGRKVYTFTSDYVDTGSTGVKTPSAGDKQLTGADNAVDTSNAELTDALLGIPTGLAEKIAGTSYRDTLINWAKGLDALSNFGDVADTYTDVRPEMGDPLHSTPALIQYGENDAGVPDLTIYTATNDGYLHAFDSDSGEEIFSFIPQELLTNLRTLMENPDGTKIYGLDGSVVPWIKDDGDNKIESGDGDHAYIYFSMRRGGRNIYAMDVTDRESPELMWVIKGGEGDYEELGESWSTINVQKIKDGGTEKTVLVFGGGYDATQDNALSRRTDSRGRAIFIADALTGERLWSGGEGGDLSVDKMEYSIPARIKPLDTSGDGLLDRMYAVDMGGQIFRFDIDNNNSAPLVSSITGARIAQISGSDPKDARRFYYPPGVALVSDDSGRFNALVISSGYRAHPLDTIIQDRIYMIKDKQTAFTTTYPSDITVESELKDVTLNLAGGDSGAEGDVVADAAREAELKLIEDAKGWYIDLDDGTNTDTWIGEKGLAEPLLLEGVAIITTYTPNMKSALNICGPALGLGKVYYVDILDATPSFPSDLDSREERSIELAHAGIPSTPHTILLKDKPLCVAIGPKCDTLDLGLGVRKTYWFEEEQ